MTAADLSRVDVPLAVLIAHMAAGLLAEDRHQYDPDDMRFAQLPCPHPELCATDADYPGFDAWITHQQTLNAARRTR
ncbi:hypothetical protein ACIQJW_08015 [Streptomyces californicus]|uniref:hypothetical protein n=1 Tax=Streptomyces californicus TaxID=67351 RepID=UPI0037F4D401